MLRLRHARIVAAVIVASGWGLTHSTPAQGKTVDVEARFLFVPRGFDSNDQVGVVIDGFLPNACYTAIQPAVEYNPAQKLYTIKPKANLLEGPDVVCATFEVPYTETAILGLVEPGTYTVQTAGLEQKMLVVERSSNIEKDVYASIDHVEVRVDLSRKEILAHLAGHFTNTCMRWQEIRVLDQGDVVLLSPLVQTDLGIDCRTADIPFKDISVKLPWRGPGRYLLHTRGFTGFAETVFTVDGE